MEAASPEEAGFPLPSVEWAGLYLFGRGFLSHAWQRGVGDESGYISLRLRLKKKSIGAKKLHCNFFRGVGNGKERNSLR